MSTPGTSPEFEELTLSNLAEGDVERQFQRQLLEVSSVLENAEAYERNKDGVIRAQILIEIDVERQEDQPFVNLDARCRLKVPKFKRTSRMAFYVGGAFTVPKLKQGELFGSLPERPSSSRVTALRVALPPKPRNPDPEDPL